MRFRFVFLCKGTDKRLLHKVFEVQIVKKQVHFSVLHGGLKPKEGKVVVTKITISTFYLPPKRRLLTYSSTLSL